MNGQWAVARSSGDRVQPVCNKLTVGVDDGGDDSAVLLPAFI